VSDISIVPMEDGVFGVQVTEGRTVTSHRVRVPDGFGDEIGVGAAPVEIVRQSLGFLLERLAHTSIRGEFSVGDLDREFDEYREELRLRCQPSRTASET